MKAFSVCLLLFLSSVCFAEGLIIYAPEHVSEYENFRIQVAPDKKFSLTVSNRCMAVQKVTGIEKSGAGYVSGSGKALIYFDNKCFEKTEVVITIEKETRRYKIGHRIFEPQDMGC